MATKKLTRTKLDHATVEAHCHEGSDRPNTILWDTEQTGFGCMASQGGAKSFIQRYTSEGRPRQITLGRVDDFRRRSGRIDVRTARARGAKVRAGARIDRADPLADRAKRKAQGTVADLAADFLAKKSKDAEAGKRAASTVHKYSLVYDRHIAKTFGKRNPFEIEDTELERWHGRITRQSGPVEANHAWRTFRAMLRFGKVPTPRIEMNGEAPREEYVRPDELAALVNAIEAEAEPIRSYFLLLILTAARGGELLNLQWSDVRGDTLTFRGTKNHRDHTVHLSAAARQILAALEQRSKTWVFRSTGRRDVPMGRPYEEWRAILERAGIDRDVRLHDLRRTAGVMLARLGYSSDQIAGQLNHKSTITAKVYVRIAEDTKQKMGDALGNIVTGPTAEVHDIRERRV